jgi:hypothetical protein
MLLNRPVWTFIMGATLAVPVRADERSDALFAHAIDAFKKAEAVTFDRTTTIRMEDKAAGQETEHIQLLRPNLWRVSRGREEPRLRVSDGKYAYSQLDKAKQVIKVDALKPDALFQTYGPAVGAFFGAKLIHLNQSGKYLGKQELEGKTYDVVQVLGETPGGIPAVLKLYFGAEGLPDIREFRSEMEKGKEIVMQERLSKVDMRARLKPAGFHFTLPPGYTIVDATVEGQVHGR